MLFSEKFFVDFTINVSMIALLLDFESSICIYWPLSWFCPPDLAVLQEFEDVWNQICVNIVTQNVLNVIQN